MNSAYMTMVQEHHGQTIWDRWTDKRMNKQLTIVIAYCAFTMCIKQ